MGTNRGAAHAGTKFLPGASVAASAAIGIYLLVSLLIAAYASAENAAQKAVVGVITTLPGLESSHEAPKGLAVNLNGAGGVGVGDVYVVNAPNNRVEAFSAEGGFTRAFGYDVAFAGPDNTGANEKQSVTIDATSGSFKLTAATGATGFGDVTQGSNVITNVSTATGVFHVGDAIAGCGVDGTEIIAVGAESLTLSANATTLFSCPPHRALTAFATTASIPFNVSAGELKVALESAAGTGSVAVSGVNGGPFNVEFIGPMGHNDVSQMDADSSGLGGGTHTASVLTTSPGGGFEVCSPVANPGDICKAGVKSTVAGGLSAPTGIAIDQENGNVYVVDATGSEVSTNSRINAYSATGAFEGGVGWKVNASTPEEKLQFCTLITGCQKGTIGGGAGQLHPGESSNAVVNPTNGHLYVADGGNARVQEFAPLLNGSNEVIGASFVKTFGWDVVASGPDQSTEVQKIRVSATAGKFTLSFGVDTTGELKFNATSEEVQSALNGLSAISAGGGSVSVTGGPGSVKGDQPYIVSFGGGPLAHTDVPQLVVHKGSLSGGSAGTEAETYANGTEGLESCVAARGDTCKAGVPGGRMGQFSGLPDVQNPASVAVGKEGEIYAVNQRVGECKPEPLNDNPINAFSPCRVYEFSFPGEGSVTAKEFAPEDLTHTGLESGNKVSATDVAVDPGSGHVLIAKKEGATDFKFLEFDEVGTLLGESPAGTVLKGDVGTNFHGLAIGTKDRFYFSNPLGMVNIFGPPPPPTVEIEPVTEASTTTATFHGKVTPAIGPGGEHFSTFYHFEYSKNGISWTPFPTSDVSVGDGSGSGSPESCPINDPPVCKVSRTIKTLEPNADYLVRLVANNGSVATSGSVAFTTKAVAPSISNTVATEIGKTKAKLNGLVNPNNKPTTYHFEWGATTAYGNETPNFEAFAGSGGQPSKVSVSVSSLKEGSAYHFRIVATSSAGETKGPDQEFTTLNSFSLPDGRAPEQVSPTDKRPVGSVSHILFKQVAFQAESDGEGILYPLLNGLPDATAGGELEYLGERVPPSWASTQITPEALLPPIETAKNATGEVLFAVPDLSCQVIESFEPLGANSPELEEDVVLGVTNLYLRSEDGAYTRLSAPVPLNGNAIDSNGFAFQVDGVSEDCKHVLFDTEYRLTSTAPLSGRGLYEWEEGGTPALRLAAVAPDGSFPAGAQAGGAGNLNSLAADGSVAFFSAKSDEGGDSGKKAVFARSGGTETVDISQSQTATPNNQDSSYQMASADGSRVFFTARYGLAANSTSAKEGSCCDLYAYDMGSEELSDLSADGNAADLKGAGVVGVLDASEDGSAVYFAARGQLVADEGKTEAQNLLGDGSYNVYLSKEGTLSFVGGISEADTKGQSSFSGSDLVDAHQGVWVADATPDGAHLLFVSKANVTGYASGGVAEAYLYSAQNGETVCVSCRTDGLKSEGNGKTRPIAATLRDGELAPVPVQARPHSLSEDGSRVFFTMPDSLAAGAVSETRNIYEWERGQVYLLVAGEGGRQDLTEFADASSSGADVFVVTKAKLAPQDFDNTTDLYDLRAPHVTGEVVGPPPPLPPPPPPCDPLTEGCQGGATPQPAPSTAPASEGFTGAGNPPTEAPKPHPHKKGKKGKKHHHKNHHHKRSHGKRAAGKKRAGR